MPLSASLGDGSPFYDTVRRLATLIAEAAIAVLALVCAYRERD